MDLPKNIIESFFDFKLNAIFIRCIDKFVLNDKLLYVESKYLSHEDKKYLINKGFVENNDTIFTIDIDYIDCFKVLKNSDEYYESIFG